MTRTLGLLLTAGVVVVAISWFGAAAAQQPSTAAPEPKMPPMPSMEGQQGDVSKPVTQIPPHKKPVAAEKKSPLKEAQPAAVEKKGAVAPRPAPARKKR